MTNKDKDDLLKSRLEQADLFVLGYLESAFWLISEEYEEAAKSVNYADFDEESWNEILQECKDFQESNAALLEEAYGIRDYNRSSAGHDFFLTRNGHGVGFWDRDLGAVGDKLTEAAKVYGETSLYITSDGQVHCE
jgi:hypothetical protein